MKYLPEVLITVAIIIVLSVSPICSASELKLHLNHLPVSHHHGQTNTINEEHNGWGISVTDSVDHVTYGYMYFTNSYGNNGPMIYLATKQQDCTVCFGFGGGYAPAYKESGHYPIIGWVSMSITEYVTIITAPTEVTAVVFSVPLN